MKVHIEKQTRKELTRGGFYHLKGAVEGAFDFDIHRIVKNYVRMVTPLEHRDKVESGRVYNICIHSIEEVPLNEKQREIVEHSVGLQYRPLMYRLARAGIPHETASLDNLGASEAQPESRPRLSFEKLDGISATFNPVVRLHSGRDPRLYFRIDMSTLRQATGIEIEEGGFYKIGITIEGVGSFQRLLRSMAARQDISFYIPPEIVGKVKVGERCKVVIDWIERLNRPNEWHTGEGVEESSWTWREVASWTDTEGAIRTYLSIGQKDQDVIRGICAFFEKEGITATMRLDGHTGVYYATVSRVDDVAMAIKNIQPFIRTKNKKMEMEGFKEYLAKPRKRLNSSIIRARKILGIEPN
jgi:hypothetical protein